MPVMHAPVRYQQGKTYIDRHRGESDNGKMRFIFPQQDDGHKDKFGCCRKDVEYQVIENGTQAVGAALQVPGYTARFSVQVI